jgi:coiled-coil domain-containing protein 61
MLMQVKDLQATERLLRTKVKNLTNELTGLKRGYRTPQVEKFSGRPTSDPGARQRRYSGARLPAANTRKPKRSSAPIRSRTPSPYGSRAPRFDPTAYVQQKRKQQSNLRLVVGMFGYTSVISYMQESKGITTF